MCQAVWRSPLLQRLQENAMKEPRAPEMAPHGSGVRFKHDLLSYVRAYGSKLRALTAQLDLYDFASVRAALVASVPGRQNLRSHDSKSETVWGWPGLKRVLNNIATRSQTARSHIILQVSSVASLGSTDAWMEKTFLDALAGSSGNQPSKILNPEPKYSLVFPTADEIRRSIDGYGSGGSIHMKTQSNAQAAQLLHLRPMLSHWAGDSITTGSLSTSFSTQNIRQAGRRRAAPHIKTYIRFSDESASAIDWAMVTSANLSTQAWGAATNHAGEVRICSYEVGVVVWPALWDDQDGKGTEMVPVFMKDTPDIIPGDANHKERKVRVGLRMPYDLPLVPYQSNEMPWCATLPDPEPDWMGRAWSGFGTG